MGEHPPLAPTAPTAAIQLFHAIVISASAVHPSRFGSLGQVSIAKSVGAAFKVKVAIHSSVAHTSVAITLTLIT